MNKDDKVFFLTVGDFESVLGRELSEDEIIIIEDKFSIDDWSEHVQVFLSVRGIE